MVPVGRSAKAGRYHGLALHPIQHHCFKSAWVFAETAGDDLGTGGNGGDRINSGGGDENLEGLGGRDSLSSGPGNHFLFGDSSRDFLSGGSGTQIELAGRMGLQAADFLL
jgi:Ca2+-binding RTX toxin-like protein